MKKFVFRPQVLIEIQRSKVEQLQNDLADAVRQLQTVQNEILTLVNRMKKNEAERKVKIEIGMTVFDLLVFNEFEEFLVLSKQEKEKELDSIEMLIAKVRADLAVAFKRQKTLERFKELRYNEYRTEKNKIDNRRMDEIGIGGFIRNS